MTPSESNRLAEQTSPYLQEHADNPVDWYPWGEEALRVAREKDRPIFLSIGYSACHWCHVMKRESFQDEAIAEVMNERFVNIKVDREERPDLDEVYMQAVQSMTGRGGWPLNVFLTPDLKPFYGGTYFPPESRQGMPAFTTVLERVHRTYEERREEVEESAEKLTDRLKSLERLSDRGSPPERDRLRATYDNLEERFDPEWGGFGSAPKFPRPTDLQFLLRLHGEPEAPRADGMVQSTLDHMMAGGIYDQLGGGFSRYSTDRRWLVPHFEKMLYDNAQLAEIYAVAHRTFGHARYRRVAEETFDYVERWLSAPSGAFYSSQDAESEDEEGRYYVWTPETFHDVLGEDAELMADFWGVTEEGNFEGQSVLHVEEPPVEFCEQRDLDLATFRTVHDEAREALLERRRERPEPHRDEKILTDWNGMMAAALTRAGWLLDEPGYARRAERALTFIEETMTREGRLYHTHREGETHTPAFLADYAFVIRAELAHFGTTGEWQWLRRAARRYERAVDLFWDASDGGFYTAEPTRDDLIVRSKNPQDGVMPSGNSEMVINALKLASLTGEADYREHAQRTLGACGGLVDRSPGGLTRMLSGLYDWHAGPLELVLVGSDEARSPLAEELRASFPPGGLLVQADPGAVSEGDSPLLEGRLDGPHPALYVCRRGTCRTPVTDPGDVPGAVASMSEEGLNPA